MFRINLLALESVTTELLVNYIIPEPLSREQNEAEVVLYMTPQSFITELDFSGNYTHFSINLRASFNQIETRDSLHTYKEASRRSATKPQQVSI